MKREGKTARVPVPEAIRNRRKSILLCLGAKVAESGLSNVYAVFAITYSDTRFALPRQVILYTF
jgi:MHS family shikimate/dehydroshikimate transporter-like MFS transporter